MLNQALNFINMYFEFFVLIVVVGMVLLFVGYTIWVIIQQAQDIDNLYQQLQEDKYKQFKIGSEVTINSVANTHLIAQPSQFNIENIIGKQGYVVGVHGNILSVNLRRANLIVDVHIRDVSMKD